MHLVKEANSRLRIRALGKEVSMACKESHTGCMTVPLFAGFIWLVTPSLDAQAASEQRCRRYASSAVADYKQMRNIPKCSKRKPQDTVRWHPQYDLHFNWCLTAQDASLTYETHQRDEFLLDCGGRGKL